ncbi:MAG: PIG-L family deacetylase [Bryobacterales bacterium]|nr:PIG-L family deacetylase [Bryobacterales bacterium]
MEQTIVAIHAHPDDIEFLAAGTLAGLSRAGIRVIMASMTAGDCGTVSLDPTEISQIRVREAANSADLVGARYYCLGFKDMAIFSDDASRRRITEFLRALRPSIVITSSPEDYMADHEATAVLVRDACFSAALPNYETRHQTPATPLPEIPALYFMDPIGGVDRNQRPVIPDFVVDIEESFDLKIAMLMEHKSQKEWLRVRHGIENYVSIMQKWTRERGALAGIRIGEGFRQYRGHPYPQDERFQDLVRKHLHIPLALRSDSESDPAPAEEVPTQPVVTSDLELEPDTAELTGIADGRMGEPVDGVAPSPWPEDRSAPTRS